MRLRSMVAILAGITAFGVLVPQTADAGGRGGWGYTRWDSKIGPHPYAYDPYAYYYQPRGYYPYYNSGYWRPRGTVCRPCRDHVIPPYYKAWGYPKWCYKHRAWHLHHHGGHRHHHW